MLIILGWAAVKVWRIAQRSIKMHKNPAYILYSDPKALNKWGFLYVQFKATMYYFIICILAYILIKGMFVAFGQGSGVAQAIGFVIVDAGLLIAVSVMRPYMDKKTNAFHCRSQLLQRAVAALLYPGFQSSGMYLAYIILMDCKANILY
jgi:hypothetical protein